MLYYKDFEKLNYNKYINLFQSTLIYLYNNDIKKILGNIRLLE